MVICYIEYACFDDPESMARQILDDPLVNVGIHTYRLIMNLRA